MTLEVGRLITMGIGGMTMQHMRAKEELHDSPSVRCPQHARSGILGDLGTKSLDDGR